MTASVPGFRAVPGRQVLHIGGRDFDAGERSRMEQEGISVVDAETFRDGATPDLGPVLEALARSSEGVYVHIDLDVLDPREAPTNMFQKPGGLSALQLETLLGIIGAHMPIRAVTFSAYDPTCDPTGLTSAVAKRLTRRVLAASHRPPSR